MKTAIYYFTGTGNSLAAARTIASALGDCGLVSIASLKDTPGTVAPAADRVGIVCPVYDAGLPLVVAEFARRLDIQSARYVFGIVTMGGTGVSALHQLDALLKGGKNRSLDAAFAVRMPGNFPPLSHPPEGEKLRAILAAADRDLQEIAAAIGRGETVPPKFSPVSALMKCITYGGFSKTVRASDTKYSVDDSCTSCGTCAKVCPVQNIRMEQDRPVWLHHCELCCACLHFCPVQAIQLNVMFGTKNRGRYRHPDLKVEDMKIQQGGEAQGNGDAGK